MKKKKVNLKQLALKKSSVASLEAGNLTGGFQSWTGTAEPCFQTELGCGGVTDNCPPQTNGCPPPPTNGCPPPTNGCGTYYGCGGQTALYSACNGLNCY
mgnify:CR=1 FL=1